MKKVTVVIANYNGAGILDECVSSALKQSYANIDIIIVDDGSTDGSAQKIQETWKKELENKKLRVFVNEENMGVGASYNLGIKESLGAGEYILKIDNDLMLNEGAIEKMVRVMEENPSVGIVGGKILYYDNRDKIQAVGGEIINLLGVIPFINILGKNAPAGSFNEQIALDTLNGCMMLFRAEVFIKHGLFSDLYGKYALEDYDFQFRVKKKGVEIVYCPESVGFHKVSYTSNTNEKLNEYRLIYSSRNHLILFYNHFPFWKFNVFVVFYFFKIVLEAVIKRRNILSLLKGYCYGLKACWRFGRGKKNNDRKKE